MVEYHIAGYLYDLILLHSFEQQSTKLDKTEADIEKARKEAERCGYVTESKVYGAAIEIIDRLRDELKDRLDYSKEITSLKNQIADLRDSIDLLADNQGIDIGYLEAERDEDIMQAEEENR